MNPIHHSTHHLSYHPHRHGPHYLVKYIDKHREVWQALGVLCLYLLVEGPVSVGVVLVRSRRAYCAASLVTLYATTSCHVHALTSSRVSSSLRRRHHVPCRSVCYRQPSSHCYVHMLVAFRAAAASHLARHSLGSSCGFFSPALPLRSFLGRLSSLFALLPSRDSIFPVLL